VYDIGFTVDSKNLSITHRLSGYFWTAVGSRACAMQRHEFTDSGIYLTSLVRRFTLSP